MDKKLLALAVAELGINVPVLRCERVSGGGLKLWLYGRGEPVTWMPKVKAEAKAEVKVKRTVKK